MLSFWRLGHFSITGLAALSALLDLALKDQTPSVVLLAGASRASHDQNRGEIHVTREDKLRETDTETIDNRRRSRTWICSGTVRDRRSAASTSTSRSADSSGRRNTPRSEVAVNIRKRRSARSGRAPLPSPGRPSAAGRDEQNRFWRAIARGLSSEEAALEAGVSQPVGPDGSERRAACHQRCSDLRPSRSLGGTSHW